ncbi:MAG: rod-binding protein [Lachnospiraceae bacterium]|nr:rod-binding protein [Lachnospiraceae bacterium]
MDISNISAYVDYAKTQASTNASKVKDTAAKDYSQASDEELLGACKEFEAYLLEQVFKEMTKTTSFVDKDSAYGNLIDFFGDNVIQEMCKQSTQSQGLGIAEQLYEQMKRNYQI